MVMKTGLKKATDSLYGKKERKKYAFVKLDMKTLCFFVTSYPGKNKDLPTEKLVAAVQRTFHFRF